MKDNFGIITDLKKTAIYLDKVVLNFPNSEKVLKDKIKSCIYDAIEYTYMANELNSVNRILHQKRVITKMKMLDFYIKISMEKKYISYKKYQKISHYLLITLKKIYAWAKYEKA